MKRTVLDPMTFVKPDSPTPVDRPFLITFSGIDGAGKTTQIEHLSSCLQNVGLRVLRLSFWDNVAVWSKMRAGVGGRTVESGGEDPMAGRSFAPRNSKHIRKWYLTVARAGLYVLDVARLRRVLADPHIRNSDVVICDRYIYDQIANIYSATFAARCCAKILLKQAPVPDLAFLLDASPTAAFGRKPEYPLEFMHRNRQNFLLLRELVPQLIVISDAKAEDVGSEIYGHIRRSRLAERTLPEGKTEDAMDSAVVPLQSSCRVRIDPTASL
jgi:thymidylate kinase